MTTIDEQAQKEAALLLLYSELEQTQTEMRTILDETRSAIPDWRKRFLAAYAALDAIVADLNRAQSGIILAGDNLRRLHKIEQKIKELNQSESGSMVPIWWSEAGGTDPELSPLRGLDLNLLELLRSKGINYKLWLSLGPRQFFGTG